MTFCIWSKKILERNDQIPPCGIIGTDVNDKLNLIIPQSIRYLHDSLLSMYLRMKS